MKTPNHVFISETDEYLFGQGTHYEIYNKLGAHPSYEGGAFGVFFAVWAPNAKAVNVVGEFNSWNESANPMKRTKAIGIWTAFVPKAKVGQMYKFLITTSRDEKLYKADPYANHAEVRPNTASIIADLSKFKWSDKRWLNLRLKKDVKKEPMAIYECHIGSFMKHPDGSEDGFYNYRQFADRITEYLTEMRYTHIELMGICEHPYDGSWGYQVTGYYAPTSRYGTPEDFMYLVNKLHNAGIGIILDWVPAHFAIDAHGLERFDGECIYEHPDKRLGEHPDWGTKIFNYGKNEVKNFLIANVLFWQQVYHVDGIRVDAVASMLYLNYGKKDGEWLPNKYGGTENLDAIEFLKHMNSIARKKSPGFITVAEESTAWPNVTCDVDCEGLGFTFKWNMGWMHDFCEYMKLDAVFRKDNHYNMTFAMTYNESEQYILPLSHDEVVHLKCSMINKMPGYKKDKYANLRAGYTFMFGHSGKKLLFMGQDFGQEREWSEKRELDWFLLNEPLNKGLHDYVRDLLIIYRENKCLYEADNSWAGFEWMNADDKDHSTYSFVRKSADEKNRLLFVFNMTPMKWDNYLIPVPEPGKYELILNSDDEKYGGWGNEIMPAYEAKDVPCVNKKQSICLNLSPYSACVYKF